MNQIWQQRILIFLQTRTDDGKTSLDFSIEASEQKFTLHCPSHYPNYGNDDNFFVEADSGLQMWCNALNEYLLDSDEQLSLSSILNKGLSLYSSADAKTRSRDVSMSSNANEEVCNAVVSNTNNKIPKKSWNCQIILIPPTVWQILNSKQMQWPETGFMWICWNLLWKIREITTSERNFGVF